MTEEGNRVNTANLNHGCEVQY